MLEKTVALPVNGEIAVKAQSLFILDESSCFLYHIER